MSHDVITRENLHKQYDRCLVQLREEVKELYWLYNFFFLIDSAILTAVLTDNIKKFTSYPYPIGFLLSLYWLWIFNKQRRWRDDWIERSKSLEQKLDFESGISMWSEKFEGFWRDLFEFLFGKGRIAYAMFMLPIGFTVIWLLLWTRANR